MECSSFEADGRTYLQILTPDQFRSVVAEFTAPPGFDYETNGQEVWHHAGRIVGVSFAAPLKSGALTPFYIPVSHQTGQNCEPSLLAALAEYLNEHPVVPFHLNTEYQWTLTRLKVRLKVAGDGFYAARLLQYDDKNLKDLAKTVLGRDETQAVKYTDLLPPGVLDFSVLGAQDPRANSYVNWDGLNSYELEVALRSAIESLGMLGAYELEMLAGAVMAEQEATGYLIKPQILARAVARERQRLDKLHTAIFADLGVKPFTLNAHVQLGKALKAKGYESPIQTPTGADSWAIDALQMLPPDPLITNIIDWKRTFSVTNSLTRAPLEPAADGRLHPHWLSIGYSGSPRMQSERPSLTNLPKAAREAFPAPPGYRWFMASWLQPETRVLAMGSGDRNMIELLNTNYDFYTTVGATMRGAEPGEGDPADREHAKSLFLALLDYCGDPTMIAKRYAITEDKADEMLDRLYTLFPGLGSFVDTVRTRAEEEPGTKRSIKSYLNRRWFIEPDERGRYDAPAMRAYAQHSVATFLKIAITRMMGHVELNHPALVGFHSLIPVYDTIFYCLDERVPVVQHLDYMGTVFEQTYNGVRMAAEYGVGPSWGEIAVITDEAFAQMQADFLSEHQPPGWNENEAQQS